MPSNSSSNHHHQPLTNEELVKTEDMLPIHDNNYVFHPDTTRTLFPVIGEILRGHPFFHALSHAPSVPSIYVQQLWNTLSVHTEDDGEQVLIGTIDEDTIRLTNTRFRKILKLPGPNAREDAGLSTFEALPNKSEVTAQVFNLGYNGPFPALSAMKRRDFAAQWCTLLSILNRSLTWKHTGYDKYSFTTNIIFLGIVHDRHYDVTSLLWREMVQLVTEKMEGRGKPSIPFPRFLSMIIEYAMNRVPSISRREDSDVFVNAQMLVVRHDVGHTGVKAARISDTLLAYADQESIAVVTYRRNLASVAGLQPDEPEPDPEAPSSPPSSTHSPEQSPEYSPEQSPEYSPEHVVQGTDLVPSMQEYQELQRSIDAYVPETPPVNSTTLESRRSLDTRDVYVKTVEVSNTNFQGTSLESPLALLGEVVSSLIAHRVPTPNHSQSDNLRGSFENPTGATTLPTLNVGHAPTRVTDSLIVSTDILDGQGTLPSPLSKFTTTELKNELLARLEAQDSVSVADAKLLEALRPEPDVEFLASAQALAKDLNLLVQRYVRSIAAKSCRAKTRAFKRSRDNLDD